MKKKYQLAFRFTDEFKIFMKNVFGFEFYFFDATTLGPSGRMQSIISNSSFA